MQFAVPVVAIGLLVFAVVYVLGTRKVDVPVTPPIAPASAPFSDTVAGNGMIEAETENIAVGSPTAGLVVQVLVKQGDEVKAGTPLFRLDDRELKSELVIREADLASARAQLERLENEPRPEEIPVQEAMVHDAQANLTQQTDNLKRIQDLFARHVSTEQDFLQAQQSYRSAQAKMEHEQAQLSLQKAGSWQYEKDVAKAAVLQAQSQVDRVKTDLDRLITRALVDGEVLQVNVRPGEFVGAPHTQALVLLGNTKVLHVRVDIDEHDIPRFTPGKAAIATIKGNTSIKFPIQYVRTEPYVVPKKSLTGDNTERVDTRVLQVIYTFDPTGKPVYVGQQVEVFIEADAAKAG